MYWDSALFVFSMSTMVAMETGHFLKMLDDASLASLGFLMWKVLGCIICKNPLWVLSCKVNPLRCQTTSCAIKASSLSLLASRRQSGTDASYRRIMRGPIFNWERNSMLSVKYSVPLIARVLRILCEYSWLMRVLPRWSGWLDHVACFETHAYIGQYNREVKPISETKLFAVYPDG